MKKDQLLTNIIASMEEGVMVVDIKGKIKVFNHALEKITGISQDKALNGPLNEVFQKDPWLNETIRKTASSGQSYKFLENTIFNKLGKHIPVNIGITPLLDAHNKLYGIISIFHDLTGMKMLEEKARRSDRLSMLGTIATGLAHEIKNPLSGIKGTMQLLEKEFTQNSNLLEYTHRVVREVDRLSNLLTRLLDFANPNQPRLKPLNINKLLDEVINLLNKAKENKNINFVREFDPSLPLILGDLDQLSQVFLNIIKNAIESMDYKGDMRIASHIYHAYRLVTDDKRKGQMIAVEIVDNGKGISKDDLQNIFVPFFTTKKKGSGLGLSISQRIIIEHSGTIEVESIPQNKTTFRIILPVYEKG